MPRALSRDRAPIQDGELTGESEQKRWLPGGAIVLCLHADAN